MSASKLLESLNELGIKVSLANNDLKIGAPKKLITPGLVQLIKENKAGIINALNASQAEPDNFPISKDSLDYVDYAPAANNQIAKTNSQEKLDYVDYENRETNLYPLNPHNPINVSKTISDFTDCHQSGWWIEQLKKCATKEEVFSLLGKFQPLDWTDQERAAMAHAYHKRLASIASERLPAAWYEIEQTLRVLVPGLSFEHSASSIKRQIAQQTQTERVLILKQLEAWSAKHSHRAWSKQIIKAVVEP